MYKMDNIHIYLWFCMQVILITSHEGIEKENIVNEQVYTEESGSTTADIVYISCSSEKLVVKGNNVNISAILNATCLATVKFIEIFALNDLLIDADIDKTGQNIQIALIAPKWTIIGERKIILNGEHGGEYFPLNAADGIGNYRHGKPGNPGGSAGRLLGIGNEFVNAQNLKIFLNGGIGGSGQHGGKGSNGVSGADPPVPDNSTSVVSTFESLQFFFYQTMNQTDTNEDANVKTTVKSFRVFGRNGTQPISGGNGGVGGIGGYAGIFFVIGLQENADFVVLAKDGDNGTAGEGGICGMDSRNGFTLDILYQDRYNMITDEIMEYGKPVPMINDNDTIMISAENGIDGMNDIGIRYPVKAELIYPSHIINNYKSFLREHLGDNDQGAKLKQFLEDLDRNERVQSLYDTFGLVDELHGLALQYFQLKKSISIMPFVERLLDITEKHANNFTESNENREVLRWLHSVLTTTLSTVKTFSNTTQIVSLPEYIDEMQAQISKLRQYENEVHINDKRNRHLYFLDSEIESVIKHIKFQILPTIEDNFAEISSRLNQLIDELYERQYKFKSRTEEIDPEWNGVDDIEIESLMMMPYDKMSPFKILNSVEKVFNSMSVRQLMITGNENGLLSDASDLPMNLNKPDLYEIIKEKYQLFSQQLSDIERELNMFMDGSLFDDLQDVNSKVRNLKFWLNNQLQNGHTFDSDSIDKNRSELITFVEEKQLKLQQSDGLSSMFDIALAILHLSEVPVDIYKQITIDKIIDMLNFNDKIRELEEDASQFNTSIEYIYDVIFQRFDELETNVGEISRNLTKKSPFALSISSWHLSCMIRDFKAFFRQLSNETSVKEILYRSIEKLEDSVNTLIDAHLHINHLTKEKSISDFVDGVSANEKFSRDSKLMDGVVNLQKTIQTNVVLDMYELMIDAFKKHYFPFAQTCELELPRDLRSYEIEKLVNVAVNNVDFLEGKIKVLDVSIGNIDQFLLNDVEFSGTNTSITGPFFTWKNSEIRKELSGLLSGEEIMLTADINEATILNAVKFNEIGIRLKAHSEDWQNVLDKTLEKVILSMCMTAKNDYRCGTDIYSFTVDNNICFKHSFKRNSNGEPITTNDIYRKLRGNRYFLSPYTTWKIQFIFQTLKKPNLSMLEDRIDIELIGRGQYISNDAVLSELCTSTHCIWST